MSIFSQKLKYYIEQKKLTTYNLAKRSGIERSNMYKIVQGTRNPSSEEMVENIAESLGLSPYDRKELLNAYQISRVGENIYFERKYITEFIKKLRIENDIEESPERYSQKKIWYEPMDSEIHTVYGTHNIDKVIQEILDREARKEKGSIKLMCQPEYEYLYKSIAVYCEKTMFTVQHIICMDGSAVDNENKYNLQNIIHLTPLIMANCDYQTNCYYDNIRSHFYNLNLFPYLLMTSDCVMQFSSDYEYALYTYEKKTYRMFETLFQKYLGKTTPMFLVNPDAEDVVKTPANGKWGGIISVLTPGPIASEPPKGFREKYLKMDEENKEELLDMMENIEKYEQNYMSGKVFKGFSTVEGLRDFVESGHLIDATAKYYRKFEQKDRIEALRRMKDQMETGRIQGYLIKPGGILMPRDFYMSVFDNHSVSISFKKGGGQWCILFFNEKSLAESFYQFACHLDESTLVYDRKESLDLMKELVEQYENLHQQEMNTVEP